MLHAVEYIRDGYFGSQFIAHHGLDYLLGANILLKVSGLSLIRQIGLEAGEQ